MSEIEIITEVEVEVDVEQPHRVLIFVNDVELHAPRSVMTGRQILELAGVPETNHLFLEVGGSPEDQPIGPDVPVKLQDGMRFYDVPVGTFG